jgi:phosphoribosyl-ATP pyrophosphohydrolase
VVEVRLDCDADAVLYRVHQSVEGLTEMGEEAVEVAVAATSEDDERLASEASDLLYHLLVLLQARSIPLDVVWRELESRAK